MSEELAPRAGTGLDFQNLPTSGADFLLMFNTALEMFYHSQSERANSESWLKRAARQLRGNSAKNSKEEWPTIVSMATDESGALVLAFGSPSQARFFAKNILGHTDPSRRTHAAKTAAGWGMKLHMPQSEIRDETIMLSGTRQEQVYYLMFAFVIPIYGVTLRETKLRTGKFTLPPACSTLVKAPDSPEALAWLDGLIPKPGESVVCPVKRISSTPTL